MNRLTENSECYYGEQQKIRQLCYMGFDGDCKYPSCAGCTILKLYRKLATYEDTGLEPEEVKEYSNIGITPKQIKELIKIVKNPAFEDDYDMLLEAVEETIKEFYEYKLIGATPEELRKVIKEGVPEWIDKYFEYRNLDKQGLLHIAPIKDGTEIFIPHSGLDEIDLEDGILKVTYLYGLTEFEWGEMNKHWFLTQEEAEKALEDKDE